MQRQQQPLLQSKQAPNPKQPLTNSPQQQPLSISHLILQLMKKTRKNSPLFKPIKKLKTSIDSIGGQAQLSISSPTKKLIVFHFGLGNDLDKDIIVNGTTLREVKMLKEQGEKVLEKEFVILPGKAFSFVEFVGEGQAEGFVRENGFRNIMEEVNTGNGEKGIEQVKKQNQGKKKQEEKETINQIKSTTNNMAQGNNKELNNQKDQNNHNHQDTPLFYFKELQYKNLSRLMIFFYHKDKSQQNNTSQHEQLVNIPCCPSTYSPSNHIPGLHLIENIITPQQQLTLLTWLDNQPWEKLSNRRVQHYGFEFKYGKNGIDKEQQYKNKMPQVFQGLLHRLKDLVEGLGGGKMEYDQLTVNDYFAGHGIPSHFDTHSPFQEYFVAISMLSGIVMDWKRYDGTQTSTYLHPRSMVVFSGEARYAWLHSIACRKLDNIDNHLKHRSRRISLTFRKIKHTPCECKYYFYCDSQGYDQNTMKKNNPLLTRYLCEENGRRLQGMGDREVYREYVLKAYNSFGYDFHNKPIPEILGYLAQQCNQSSTQPSQPKFLLDIGCGNGQYKKHLTSSNIIYIGIQRCQVMLPLDEKMLMDGMRLCFRDESFDVVLLVAVLHHFSCERDRVRCLKEAGRVVKRGGGVVYVTVFNYQSKSTQYPSQDILLDYCLPTHKTLPLTTQHSPLTKQPQHKNILTPQKQQGKPTQKGEIFSRYYHLFRVDELEELIQRSGLEVVEMRKSRENIVVKLVRGKQQEKDEDEKEEKKENEKEETNEKKKETNEKKKEKEKEV